MIYELPDAEAQQLWEHFLEADPSYRTGMEAFMSSLDRIQHAAHDAADSG